MAITLTKKITSTFANGRPSPGDPDSPASIIGPYIADQVSAGKTDGVIDIVDNDTSIRLWADQTSAQNYSDFVISTMTGLGRTDLTNVISDI
jgi:hypothetical protein